jgi:glutaminyl-tRNA synthetase
LLKLIEEDYVSGWDDPRLPTIRGLRRRGYTPSSIRKFSDTIGVAKSDSTIDHALLEHVIRNELNKTAGRVMSVLNPLKVIIDNYPEGEEEYLEAVNNPEDPSYGTRQVPFSKELYIEQDDFMEDPPKKFYRLAPGREVRLRYAYFLKCNSVDKDEDGNIIALHCTYDPATKGGSAPDGRKVKATMHWVSAKHAIDGEIRLYDNLFTKENPENSKDGRSFEHFINENSLQILKNCKLEPSLQEIKPETQVQFERLGYFCADRFDHSAQHPVFNRIVTLRDTWKKIQKRQAKQKKKKK